MVEENARKEKQVAEVISRSEIAGRCHPLVSVIATFG